MANITQDLIATMTKVREQLMLVPNHIVEFCSDPEVWGLHPSIYTLMTGFAESLRERGHLVLNSAPWVKAMRDENVSGKIEWHPKCHTPAMAAVFQNMVPSS